MIPKREMGEGIFERRMMHVSVRRRMRAVTTSTRPRFQRRRFEAFGVDDRRPTTDGVQTAAVCSSVVNRLSSVVLKVPIARGLTAKGYVYAVLVTAVLLLAGGAHAQITELKPPQEPHPTFGTSVALDGRRALVGASGEDVCGPNSGAAYLFEQDDDGDWRFVARLVPLRCRPNAFFGRSLDLSGDRALIGASSEYFAEETPDVAYVFTRENDGTWRETAQLRAGSETREGPFAASVSLDGDRAIVTTWGDVDDGLFEGAAYLFAWRNGRWRQTVRLEEPTDARGIFGGAADLDGETVVVSASTYLARKPGSVYVFERRPDDGWQAAAHIGDVDAFFVAVDLYGDQLLIGSPRSGRDQAGRALLYARGERGTWRRRAVLRRNPPFSYGAFGTAVSLDSARALVTGYDEQFNLDVNIDRVVYVFAPDRTGTWRERQVIDIGEPTFGSALDHEGDLALVGNARNTAPGAAYVVQLH